MRAAACQRETDDLQGLEQQSGFNTHLRSLIEEHVALWNSRSPNPPITAATFEPGRQKANERLADRFLDRLEHLLRSMPDSAPAQDRWRAEIVAIIREFSFRCLDLPSSGLDLAFREEGQSASRSFLQQARAFDRDLELADLSQALRNVWVMNCIQIHLGQTPSATPSVVAYSLLYPYTDNFLDEPGTSSEAKERLNRRIGQYIRGEDLAPETVREASIFRLLSMIENDSRTRGASEVRLALLAIHDSQVQSLRQQGTRAHLGEEELLRISVAKGGASVLADGYLVGGKLSTENASFCFGLGVLLQLADDLEDVDTDLANGHQTLFSRRAGVLPLDAAATRLMHFLEALLASVGGFAPPNRGALRELIRRNSANLVLRSVARRPAYFTDAYVRYMESFSPLRFAYLREREPVVEQRLRAVERDWRQRHPGLSLLDLLH